MFDLTAFEPFVIGFFVIAAVAVGLSVATLVALAQERRDRRRSRRRDLRRAPGGAAVTRRAA